MKYLWRNWTGIILCCYLMLFFCWMIGFFCNALYNVKFELSSVWAGVASISTAGVLSWGKHWVDSKHNSMPGQMPAEGEGKCG